jgi:hypothetical protein
MIIHTWSVNTKDLLKLLSEYVRNPVIEILSKTICPSGNLQNSLRLSGKSIVVLFYFIAKNSATKYAKMQKIKIKNRT